MAYRNLIPMLSRLAIGRKQYLIQHLEALMKDRKNDPILEDFIQLIRDIEYKLIDLEKKARMGIPFNRYY